jgi:hypothetical protein
VGRRRGRVGSEERREVLGDEGGIVESESGAFREGGVHSAPTLSLCCLCVCVFVSAPFERREGRGIQHTVTHSKREIPTERWVLFVPMKRKRVLLCSPNILYISNNIIMIVECSF